ncbi:MAG: PAS domain S-box protein [Syntrophaceae bacterium]|nr:PAS domain S-box protein [Syntrophaceae bacterium]
MTEPLALRDESTPTRLRILMLSRLLITTLLLAMYLYLQFRERDLLPEISTAGFGTVIFAGYALSAAYAIFHHFHTEARLNVYLQSLGDVLLVTGLVHVTGGVVSVYAVFFPLIVIYSVFFLGRGGGMIIASGCSVCYGLLIDLEYYGIIAVEEYVHLQFYEHRPGYVFTRIVTYILSFYVIAFLASFVVERERRTQTLLAEKESAFDQLDLLHRSIIESVDAGIVTMNLQQQVKSFNRAAAQITGFHYRDVENRNINEVFPGFSRAAGLTENRAVNGYPRSRFEMPFRGKGGEQMILGYAVSALKDKRDRRIGHILIFQDLTAIKQMEESVEKSRRLAFIGEMAAGLAHEIRNPLASISGSIQVLKDGLVLPDADHRLMQIILRGREQLENVVRDFLLLARPSSGHPESFDPRQVIEDVIESLRYVTDWNEGIQVARHFRHFGNISANRTEFRQVLWNLLLNAVQAMPEGGTLTVETDMAETADGKRFLQLRISDSGPGIDSSDLEKIFEPFYTTKERGTGLGLAIVNRIVEGMEGRIDVETHPERGTTFRIRLPLLENGTVSP